MLSNPKSLFVPLLLGVLAMVSAIAAPDSGSCKCRMLNRLTLAGIEATCSTDNCNASQACVPQVFGNIRWCMCNNGGPTFTYDQSCFCKSGFNLTTLSRVCEALENCGADPEYGTGICQVVDPPSPTWHDQCECWIAVPF